jgi:hypothetical protein
MFLNCAIFILPLLFALLALKHSRIANVGAAIGIVVSRAKGEIRRLARGGRVDRFFFPAALIS